MISTEEAKLKQVSGWDVFLSDHIAYVSQANANWVVCQLCSQSLLFANDSTIINLRDKREEEARLWRQFLERGGLLGRDPTPDTNISLFQLQHWRLDCFKLGAAFESALKARLLRKGYLLHLISSSQKILSSRQRNAPIAISEFKQQASSLHNGVHNFFPTLAERTVSFDTLLKVPAYLEVLELPDQHVQFFDELRRLRNLIHLPLVGEHVTTPFLAALGANFWAFLVGCLNEYLVQPHNDTCFAGRQEPRFAELG